MSEPAATIPAATIPAATVPAGRPVWPSPVRALPVWPLLVMFGLVPLWWLLGLFYLAWPAFGLLLLGVLAVRGRVALPPGTAVWLLFLGLVLLSFVQLPQASAVLIAGLRWSFYATALVVGVYVYELARASGPAGTLAGPAESVSAGSASAGPGVAAVWRPLCLFWLALVALGWLGVLAPQFTAATPAHLLLPSGLASQPFLRDLTVLATTEPQSLAVNPTYRPSAPFPYTNTWGSSFAVLVPCVLAYLWSVRAGLLRLLLLISIPLSLVPAFLTLNRGMFVSLGAGLAVVGTRALWQGDLRRFLALGGLLGLGWLATLAIPVGDLIEARVASSGTNEGRRWLYEQALLGVAESPLLGHGAPATVDTMDVPPVGTQGQLWTVVFSHGVPALICFAGWFLVVLGRGAAVRSPAGQWLVAVPVVALVQLPFYGLTFHNLSLVFFAAGLLLADPARAGAARARLAGAGAAPAAQPPVAARPAGSP